MGERARARGALEECKAFAVELGSPASDGEAFFNAKEGNGWKNGKNPVKDWRATFRNWKANGWHPSQKIIPTGGGRSAANGGWGPHGKPPEQRDYSDTKL